MSPPDDPCAPKPVVPGGSAEVGLGSDFTPIMDGEDTDVVLGGQGLWMFVANARTCDLNVGDGDHEGVVVFSVLDETGQAVSIDEVCRVRAFAERAGGGCPGGANYRYLSSIYQTPLLPDFSPRLEGARVTIQLEVRDLDGRRATSAHTVVAHFPPSGP